VILIVGRLDDGNSEDGFTVDVDIELGYNVGNGSTVGDMLGTKDEMMDDGIQEETAVGASLGN